MGTVPDNGYLVGPYRVLPGRLSVSFTEDGGLLIIYYDRLQGHLVTLRPNY